MGKIMFSCVLLLIFLSCSNDGLIDTFNFDEDDVVEKSLLTDDNKIALHAFLRGVDFNDVETRSAIQSVRLRYYYHPAGNCFPMQVDCLPDVIIIAPQSSEETKMKIWETTEEGTIFTEEVNNGNYTVEAITNDNGTFVFYRDKNERQIVVQLK